MLHDSWEEGLTSSSGRMERIAHTTGPSLRPARARLIARVLVLAPGVLRKQLEYSSQHQMRQVRQALQGMG